MRKYRILVNGEFIVSSKPGIYAGWNGGKSSRRIFGSLDCKSGMRMKKENRVFFHTLEDAVTQGYRPCKNCNPIDEDVFDRIKDLVSQYKTLDDFYNRDKK